MISLRKMLEPEYQAYLDYFIPDYAAEIAANYGLTLVDAAAQAQREIAHSLPHGPQTAGHILFCIFDSTAKGEDHVGYLWCKPDTEAQSVFIYDFGILPAFQGRGLGKAALARFEHDMAALGFKQIKLRVAGDNARAKHVYERGGFRVTGINMAKSI